MSKEMNYCIDCIHCDEWMNCEYGNRRIEDVPCIAFEKGKKSPYRHTNRGRLVSDESQIM